MIISIRCGSGDTAKTSLLAIAGAIHQLGLTVTRGNTKLNVCVQNPSMNMININSNLF